MDSLQRFEFEGVSIAYARRGSGPPLVFLHNAGAAHGLWAAQLAALAGEYTVFALDLTGYGASDAPADPAAYILARYTRTVRAFLLEQSLEGVALVGNCLGAAIALNLARQYPGIGAVVAINPLTERTALAGGIGPLARLARIAPPAVLNSVGRWRTPHWLVRAMVRFWFADRAAYRASAPSDRVAAAFPLLALAAMGRDLPSFRILEQRSSDPARPPVCTVWGAANPILSSSEGQRLNTLLNPERQVILPGCGHAPMLERPEQVTAVIAEFLAAHRHSATID
ncbi:alpha/beta fold hydrolase [Nocardia sp. NPDC051570]|uniref:alpha/beta fold hydrolase n=1 Tax=Nocardia sp. NPDC051570 TaxID=3364324 RepID=UPI0037996DAC